MNGEASPLEVGWKGRALSFPLIYWAFTITRPWWFTEKVSRQYLKPSVPFLNGRLLDVGCGNKPYRDLFKCDEYIGIDISNHHNPDIVGDVKNMIEVGDESYDSVISNQVLEHVDDYESVVSEIYRVLRPGGYLCISVPFIGRLHGMPHDYWRFSVSGLRFILEKYQFKIKTIEPMGGFLTTQCNLWHFYIYERCQKFLITRFLCCFVTALLNLIFISICRFDRDKSTPSNYLAIAQK